MHVCARESVSVHGMCVSGVYVCDMSVWSICVRERVCVVCVIMWCECMCEWCVSVCVSGV